MRKFKRLASLALAAVMTLAMCAPAFAVEGDGEGIQDPASSTTTETKYDVYQIFTGTYAKLDGDDKAPTLGDIKWGFSGKLANGDAVVIGTAVDSDILDKLKIQKDKTDKAYLDVITKYVDFKKPITDGVNITKEAVNDLSLPDGYYLVRENSASASAGGTFTYFVKAIDGSLNFNPKSSSVPDVKKTVEGVVQNSNKNTAAIGSVLTYTVEGTFPANIADYETYYYTFTDTMSKGLTFNKDSVVIKVNDEDVVQNKDSENKQFYIGVSPDGEDKTGVSHTITIGVQDIKAAYKVWKNDEKAEITKDDKIVITYTATLNNYAETGKDPNTNTIQLTYSNDPQNSKGGEKGNDPENPPTPENPTGKTVTGENKSETKTYVTGLTITDFAGTGTDKKPMTGATFKLSGAGLNVVLTYGKDYVEPGEGEIGTWYKLKNGLYTEDEPTEATSDLYENTSITYVFKDVMSVNSSTDSTVTASIDRNGSLTISGLNRGKYDLEQISAPAGYNLIEKISFEIKFSTNETGNEALFYIDNTDQSGVYEGNGEQNGCGVTTVTDWFYLDLDQQKGTLLPETGGIGTTLLYIGGVLLIAVAGATFILRGKKEEEAI